MSAIRGNFAPKIQIDTSELKDLARGLKAINPIFYRKLNERLKEAGKLVAEEAKVNASWSTKIPRTIHVSASMSSVSVTAGGKRAPGARPLEHEGRQGNFRHPVFGHRNVWVDQPARPFIIPALEKNRYKVLELIKLAVNETFDEITRNSHGL